MVKIHFRFYWPINKAQVSVALCHLWYTMYNTDKAFLPSNTYSLNSHDQHIRFKELKIYYNSRLFSLLHELQTLTQNLSFYFCLYSPFVQPLSLKLNLLVHFFLSNNNNHDLDLTLIHILCVLSLKHGKKCTFYSCKVIQVIVLYYYSFELLWHMYWLC